MRQGEREIGFSLIELMIVIAIVGILAAIAIPAYQDYTIRAKISEVLGFASKDNMAISEYFMTDGKMPANAEEAGLTTLPEQSLYLQAINYELNQDSQAVITYTLQNLTQAANDTHLVFVGTENNGAINWECTSQTDTPQKYLPQVCRTG